MKIKYIILTIYLIEIGCCNFTKDDNYGYTSFDLNELPDDLLLFIPTYDGFNQAVHLNVLFFSKMRKSHHFYLVMTPYPWGKNC